jgi:PAS domain S-box-containing protein
MRKQAEEGLGRSEEELRALANSIPQLAWMTEPDGHIYWYNQRWYEYTGSTLEQMLGWGWEKVHHPDHIERVIANWKQALSEGHPWEDTFPLRGTDGQYRWFLSRAFPLRDADGKITRWLGTNTDIEEVKRAQEALQEETRILELLNNTGTEIASQLDLEKLMQTITDAGRELSGAKFGALFFNRINEAGESMFLYTLSGAPRSAFDKFGLPRNTPIFNPTFTGKKVVRSDDITQDARYGRMAPHHGIPEGHIPVRSYLAVSVISRSGEVMGGLFFGHPEPHIFTARSERLIVGIAAQAAIAIDNSRLYEATKKTEVALRATQEELELRVIERTAKLSEAVRQMEEFSYTVSHDLRAPLRAMQAYSKLLLEDLSETLTTKPEAQEYLRRIANNANRLDKMIVDVLTFSRVARQELQLKPVSTDKLIRELVENYPSMLPPSADIKIGPLADVMGHEPSLMQLMSNLLTNAVKFVAPGKLPVIQVWTEKRGSEVRIWVKDNGIGISPQYQHRLFRMFERIHPDLNYEGTGVGLAIVRKAAERMNGTVGMESDGQSGSQFWIQLAGTQAT